MKSRRQLAQRSVRAELRSLALGDPPERWRALGFEVDGGVMALGEILVALGAPGRGIVGWSLSGADGRVDGLPVLEPPPVPPQPASHPNGALGIDHVVVATPDLDRTAAALEAADMPLRRRFEWPDGKRMGFRRLGPTILELVEDGGPGPARFWGLTVVVSDLGALAARLGGHLGPIRPAVQPGRRIVTLRETAGLGQAVAFMDPERD
jgi:hypothetical protein